MSLRGLDERPWLVLCEGEGDKRFLDNLIAFRHIPNDFQIRFPDRGVERRGGRSKFGTWLANQQLSEDFRKNIKGILVISDNDLKPADSFKEVQAALKEATGFPQPLAERVVTRSAGFPSIVVLMIPVGKPGSLETLCEEAALSKWPAIKAPLDAFMAATPPKDWHAGKQGKMRLQTIIAATCKPRPESGFVGHWNEHADYHLPLNHKVFNGIEAFLRGFGAQIAAP